MAAPQQNDIDTDPIAHSFVVDRQVFWNRFTSFTTGAITVVILLLIGLWLFVA